MAFLKLNNGWTVVKKVVFMVSQSHDVIQTPVLRCKEDYTDFKIADFKIVDQQPITYDTLR